MASQFNYTAANAFGEPIASQSSAEPAGPWTDADFAPQPPKPMEGPAQDAIWSSLKTWGGKLLNSMGTPQDALNAGVGLSPESEKSLRDAGIFNDYQNGHTSFIKSVNEALIRPAATAANIVMDTLSKPIQDIATAATGASNLIEGDHPTALREVFAAPFGATGEVAQGALEGFLPEFGGAHEIAAVEGAARSETLRSAATARSLGVTGEGEAGFYDAVPVTPENARARAAAAQEAGLEPPATEALEAPIPEGTPAETSPSIPTREEVARRIDPETFGQYDALTTERETLRDQIEQHQQARAASPEAEAARTEIADLLGVEHEEPVEATIDRDTAFRASASDAQIYRLDDAYDRLDNALAADTPEQAALRDRLTSINFALRDLTPAMSDAMRNASDMMPNAGERAATPEEAKKGAQAAPERPQEGERTEGAPTQAEAAQTPPVAASAEAQAEVAPGRVTGDETIGGGPAQTIARGFEADTRDAPQPQEGTGTSEPTESGSEGSPAQSEGSAPAAERPKPRYTNALRPTEGTGELATRGLARSIQDDIEANFGDLPEYNQLSMSDQAAKSLKLINDDYANAKAIAMGDKQPPKGILPESVLMAVRRYAIAEGDSDTLRTIATRSRLVTAGTTMGQRIRTLAEKDPADPVSAIQEVQTARSAELARRGVDIVKATRESVNEARSEMRRAVSSSDKLADFIKSIQCEI